MSAHTTDEDSEISSPTPAKLSKTENVSNGGCARIPPPPTCSLDIHSHNSVVTVRALLKSTRASHQDEGEPQGSKILKSAIFCRGMWH